MKRLLIILFMLTSAGCATVSTAARPNSYYKNVHRAETGKTDDSKSILGSSDIELANKDIEKLLNYHLKFPAKIRIAIVRLSDDNYWHFYSNEFMVMTDNIANNFVGQLRKSPHVYDASFLPNMLMPSTKDIPNLRTAAAWYQADMVLAYRPVCRTYEKYKVFNPNETKAYCTVDAALLDVRTGIIPFSAVSTNDASAEKKDSDKNFEETINKAKLEAIGKSLKEVALRVNEFMKTVDTM